MGKTLLAIAIFGASGLIGEAVSSFLSREGFPIVPFARRFTHAQRAALGPNIVECPFVDFSADRLSRMLTEKNVEIVVNCVGVLHDGPGSDTENAHRYFVEGVLAAIGACSRPILLIHISIPIPGESSSDKSPFSRTKRDGERAITNEANPFVILRPGFVVAPAAFGGSALIRALAVLPFDLPKRDIGQSFAVTDVSDIARTIGGVARRWSSGERQWNSVWDVMAQERSTVGDTINAFRKHLGGPKRHLPLPSWIIRMATTAGDLAATLGWAPPIRSTALQELRRGVVGNPETWIAATGIQPSSLGAVLRHLPATVQEKWFARLYFIKAAVLVTLALFWLASGLIPLTLALEATTAILTSHGLAPSLALAVVIACSAADIAIGAMIATQRMCRAGLLCGIGLALAYLVAISAIAPEIWIEPLGPLVKTVPAIILMTVALAILDNR